MMRRIAPKERLYLVVLGITAALLLTTQLYRLEYVAEDVAYTLDPSASRALEYGGRHFNSQETDVYDIARAERFFLLALRSDSQLQFVHYELARIDFLHKRFVQALWHINKEIEIHSDEPKAFYVRGLIKGFMEDYAGAVADYQTFLKYEPASWAGANDYAWVLLKSGRPREALAALNKGLVHHPLNPWLLNSKAIALYELGRLWEARNAADLALQTIETIPDSAWLNAYPGNDPLVAGEGMRSFKEAIKQNMHTIELALQKQKNYVP